MHKLYYWKASLSECVSKLTSPEPIHVHGDCNNGSRDIAKFTTTCSCFLDYMLNNISYDINWTPLDTFDEYAFLPEVHFW